MNPLRDLLPGNADLAELAAQLPRERRGSSWHVMVMVAISVGVVIDALVVASHFEQIYLECGFQIPRSTDLVLHVWFHVAALVALGSLCVWRYRAGPESWATRLWFALGILYVGFVVVALFIPLIVDIEQLGSQAGPKHQ